jgi:Serine acetyltransferase, N-terminal
VWKSVVSQTGIHAIPYHRFNKMATTTTTTAPNSNREIECYNQLVIEAKDVLEDEPEIENLLKSTILHPRVDSFPAAIASTMVYRLLGPAVTTTSAETSTTTHVQMTPVDASTLFEIFREAYTTGTACTTEDCYQNHHNGNGQAQLTPIRQILLSDVLCVMDRDPAMDTMLEVILFAKGFASLACHRVSNWKWTKQLQQQTKKKSFLALWLQSTVSAVFGVDIHPAATVGSAVMCVFCKRNVVIHDLAC